MNRRELVNTIAAHTHNEARTVESILKGFTDVVMATVAKGDSIVVSGFAKFARVQTKARNGRNPATGQAIRIPASKKAHVTPLKGFQDIVHGDAPAPRVTKSSSTAKSSTAKSSTSGKPSTARSSGTRKPSTTRKPSASRKPSTTRKPTGIRKPTGTIRSSGSSKSGTTGKAKTSMRPMVKTTVMKSGRRTTTNSRGHAMTGSRGRVLSRSN